MPTVKFARARDSENQSPEDYQDYLSQDRGAEIIESRHLATEGNIVEQFRSVHEQHNSKAESVYVEIFQSWRPEESNLMEPEKYNEMGLELVKRLYPEHIAQVITHQDKPHIHNHILISKVNTITGKAVETRLTDWHKLTAVNDAIAKENGFSIPTANWKDREAKLPQRAREQLGRGRSSWMHDLMQKADLARAVSTTFDQYVAAMDFLGVHARVENKNVSYNFDNRKPVRGDYIGTKYDKEGLMKVFKENDGKFAKHAELRATLWADIKRVHDQKGNLVGTPSDLLLESASYTRFGKKDYSQYTKLSRDHNRSGLPPGFGNDGILPLEALKKVKSLDLTDYCKRNNIALKTNAQGKSVLVGREYVSIEGSTWKNANNHRVGSALEFVAYHHQETFLQAAARITENPRLLLLEKAIGEVKRPYSSFYIPKQKQMAHAGATHRLKSNSQTGHLSSTELSDLMNLKKLQVSHNGSVWMFAGDKGQHAVEFSESNGKQTKRRHGDVAISVEERKGSSKRLVVFADPFASPTKGKGAKGLKREDSFIVPLSLDAKDGSVERFLAHNPHVKHVDIVFGPNSKNHAHEKSEIERLKKSLNPFSIQVRGIELDHLSRGRGHGPSIDL